MQEMYAVMRIKTHLNNALYQITAVCFEQEHEHELVIAESPAGSLFVLNYIGFSECKILFKRLKQILVGINAYL